MFRSILRILQPPQDKQSWKRLERWSDTYGAGISLLICMLWQQARDKWPEIHWWLKHTRCLYKYRGVTSFNTHNSNFFQRVVIEVCVTNGGFGINHNDSFPIWCSRTTSSLQTECDKLLTNQSPRDIPSLRSGHLNSVQWILVWVTSTFPWDSMFDIQQSIIFQFCSNYCRRIIILEKA